MRAYRLSALLFYSSLSLGYDHTLTIETLGGSVLPSARVGDTISLQLDTQLRDRQIWGSVQVEFDPTVLKALYVDESHDLYGYMTWWIDTPGSVEYCGGGAPYYYQLQGGTTRADLYALEYGEGIAGPSAYLDNSTGRIRFFQHNYLSSDNYRPLLLGFELLKKGDTTITVKSQAEREEFGWCALEQALGSTPDGGIVVTDTRFSFGHGAVKRNNRLAATGSSTP